MELKDETAETLKIKLHKTKRLMQVLTWIAIITLGFLIYGWFTKSDGIDSPYSAITIASVLFVVFLDKKYKKIKAELDTRE